MKRFIAWLGMLCLFCGILFVSLHLVGTDAKLYYRLQMKADVLSEAWVTEDELIVIDGMLARYLSGDATALDDSPFNEDELLHMRDCLDLFALLRKAILLSLSAALLLILTARLSGLLDFMRPAVYAAVTLLLIVCALATWGIFDFTSLFTAMHRLLFTNGLWLMDPATDLMICICPESLFSSMAALIGLGSAAGMLITILICGVFRNRHGRRA